MPINKVLYFGDFVAIPVATLVLMYLALSGGGGRDALEFAVTLITGVVFWTFVEYWIHRTLYHHAPVLSPLHDLHHQQPEALIGVPSFLSSGFIIVVCYTPLMTVAPIAASGFTAGVLIGYAAYMYVHHATHHLRIEPGHWLYRARVRHMAHHYADQYNFGVSTGFWDRVFGTVRAKRDRFA